MSDPSGFGRTRKATRRVAVVLGTRPEAIKLAPVVRVLRESNVLEPLVVSTGQHQQMVEEVLALFGVAADENLDVHRPGQNPAEVLARAAEGISAILRRSPCRWVVVQGDTTTTLAGALAAYYHRVPLAHVEAGLRSWDFENPFPEEMNRVLTSRVASLHFAPTAWSRKNLLAEGIDADRVLVTGNTVIDALRTIREEGSGLRVQGSGGARAPQVAELRTLNPDPRRLVLITAHRRENWGAPFESICRAVRRLAERWTDCRFVFPVHPNPALRESADAILGDVATDRLCSSPAGGEGRARGKPDARLREGTGHRPRVALLGPTPYVDFVGLLNEATLVLTDSGGVQEEAAALGRPALVLRETTERPEAVEAGAVCLVGTNEERIVEVASTLLSDPERYASMARATDCFGDGRASRRIVAALENVATGSLLVGRRAMPLDLALPHGAVGVS